VYWKEAKVLQIEPNNIYSKHKETAHMFLVTHLIGQPGWDIFSICTPVIKEEVRQLNYIHMEMFQHSISLDEFLPVFAKCFYIIIISFGLSVVGFILELRKFCLPAFQSSALVGFIYILLSYQSF
jgi:hypothetical protein